METYERSRVHAYFRRITGQLPVPGRRPAVVLITHLLPERSVFVTATARLATLAAILPKPKSADPVALAEVAQIAPCDTLDRHRLAQADQAIAYLESRAASQDLVILDVGGYFAPALDAICGTFSGQILGVVEDTENGLRRYLALPKTPCPVFSVARSPLKDPEDFLSRATVLCPLKCMVAAYWLRSSNTGASDVADHVERYLAVYHNAVHDPADRGAYEALVRYFIDRSLEATARSADPDLTDASHRLIAQFVAHGFAGAIRGWLSEGSVTKADLVEAVVACSPSWWR